MIWKICFWCAVVCIAAGITAFLYHRKQGENKIRYLGAAVLLACIFTCFPAMCLSEQPGFALAMSVSQSIRMFVVDTGTGDILELLPANTLGMLYYPYKILVCLLYLLAPVFTLSVVLRYFSNFFERLRLTARRKQSLYIFSELNERSLETARGIRRTLEKEGEKSGIIFCRSNEKDDLNKELEESAAKLNAVFVAGDMMNLRLNNKKRYTAYFHISDDEEKNIDNTLQMIDSMTGNAQRIKSGKLSQKNTAVYCYASAAEAEILLDAKEKENLRVVLMNEVRDAVYEHLYRYPLYSGIDPEDMPGKAADGKNRLSVLVAGGGKTGLEFLKAAVWGGQMKDFEPDIHMIDLKGNLIRKKLQEECPELFAENVNYRIDIQKANVFSNMTEKYLDGLPDISYCVVCLGDDEDNIRAALLLKKYFYMRKSTRRPLICVYVKSPGKRAALCGMHENTRTNKKLYYGIIPFGNRGAYFGDHSDAAFILEYLGLGVQAHYWRLDKNSSEKERKEAVRDFYRKQTNRRSSIANGLHINSKLWELGLGILRVPRDRKTAEIFSRYIHEVDFRKETAGKIEEYYNLEHERWMAYMRTEGWRLASKGGDSLDDIRKCYEEYCEEFKNQNYMMKLHPALVPIQREAEGQAELQEVDDMIVEVNRLRGLGEYYPEYVQSDKEVVEHIGDIVAGEWCGDDTVNIHGMPAGKGECIICTLDDMLRYYMYLLDAMQEKAGGFLEQPGNMLLLRSEIRRGRAAILRKENI